MSSVDIDRAAGHTRPALPALPLAAAIGLSLGGFAFAADSADGLPGAILRGISSGPTWALAVFLTAFASEQRRSALAASVTVPVTGTLAYYLLIILIDHQRWQGQTLGDGSPGDYASLINIVKATAFWIAVSVCAGLVLGLLGHLARVGGPVTSSVVGGVTLGLLAAQGLHGLIFYRVWLVRDEFGVNLLVTTFSMLLVSLCGLLIYLWLTRNTVSARVLALAGGVTVAAGVPLWWAVELGRRLLEI